MLQTASPNPDLAGREAEFDVELRKVFKVFNGETAVRGVEFGIRRGEFFSILGPSGCGKTTTLRLIGGFEMPSAGEVLIRGQSMTQVPAYRRPVNTVFQSYALFDHMNVRDNIGFGLRLKKMGKAEIQHSVDEVLELVKLEPLATRFPKQLSGGQRQRVALARALVNRPAVLLLDEPLGALDLKLRKEMQYELSSLHQDLGVTFVMVTHDQEEALSMSDRIAVMNDGRIEQIGTPQEIYDAPKTPFIADFIGDTNLFEGHVEEVDGSVLQVRSQAGLDLAVDRGDLSATPDAPRLDRGSAVVVSVRPEKIDLHLYPPETSVNSFEGRLTHAMYLGTHVQFTIELATGATLTVRQSGTSSERIALNTPVFVSWSPTSALALPR